MKKLLLLLVGVTMAFSSCKKGTVLSTEAEVEDLQIQTYIRDNGLTNMIKDPSGVYYKIVKPGTGAYPTSTSGLQVSYSGKLLNGTVFDTESGYSISLTQSILGWQYAIPHINVGGRILFIVPSALGYGAAGSTGGTTGIPSNSVLVFTIDLLGFQ